MCRVPQSFLGHSAHSVLILAARQRQLWLEQSKEPGGEITDGQGIISLFTVATTECLRIVCFWSFPLNMCGPWVTAVTEITETGLQQGLRFSLQSPLPALRCRPWHGRARAPDPHAGCWPPPPGSHTGRTYTLTQLAVC